MIAAGQAMSSKPSRCVIVTGASKGIGADIARRFGREGYSVVVNYARSQDHAQAIVHEVKSHGGNAIAVRADVGQPDGVRLLFDATIEAFGRVDVLVNNAGMLVQGAIADVEDDSFEAQVALNIGAVFRGMREAARRMADNGRIITISSSVVGLYHPKFGVYAATKSAVDGLTRVVAKELGPRGITVNAVSPGQVVTDLFLAGKTQAELEMYTSRIPLGRLGQPDDISGVVAFLAGPDGRWINGQVIRANGGVV